MSILNPSRGDGLIDRLRSVCQRVQFHSLLAFSGCIQNFGYGSITLTTEKRKES